MSDPDLAVDGDPATAWRPGPGGRMVIDLGARYALDRATLSRQADRGDESLGLGEVAGRYLAIQAPRWEGNTGLSEIGLFTENWGRSEKPMFFGWCGVVGTSSLFVTEVGVRRSP